MRITPPKADFYIIAPMEFHQLPSPDRYCLQIEKTDMKFWKDPLWMN